jgi:flagellar biosynthetic protein FliP
MIKVCGRRVRFNSVAASVAALLVSATPLAAQDISINFGQGAAGAGGLNERIIQLIALLTVLSLAPSWCCHCYALRLAPQRRLPTPS